MLNTYHQGVYYQLTAMVAFANFSGVFPTLAPGQLGNAGFAQLVKNERKSPAMKVRLVGLTALCCTLALIASFSGANSSHSQTQKTSTASGLSQAEQDLLTEINQARANPGTYASYLANLKPFFNGKEYQPTGRPALKTQEGWAAVEDAIEFLRTTKPLGPLTTSTGLSLSAQVHVKDQGRAGTTGHKGTNDSLIEQRVKPFGNWQGAIGENLTYGNDSARERVLTWLVDDGFASRGHRKRLLSSDYKVAGLSCGPHPQFGTMCCLTLAGGFTDLQPAKSTTSTQTNSGTQTNKSKTTSGKTAKSRAH
jgi:uncharacterized protein YkwD